MNELTFNYRQYNITMTYPHKKDYSRRRSIQYNSFYEPKTLRSISILVKNPRTIVDIGAYVGNHTVFFSKVCKAKDVYSFEPQKDIFKYLENNIKINNLVSVHSFNTALGEKKGKCKIKIIGKDNHKSMNSVEYTENGNIDVNTLDSYEIKDVDLIKIDTEGNDLLVLIGAEKTIEKYHPLIVVEARKRKDAKNLRKFLEPKGYECFHVVEYNMFWRYNGK